MLSYRDTVMAMLSLMDPHGTEQRKKRRLERRVYRSKVGNLMRTSTRQVPNLLVNRDQTLCGIVTATIN